MSGRKKLTSEGFASILFADSLRTIYSTKKSEFDGDKSVQDIFELLINDEMGARMVQESMRTYLLSFKADSDQVPALDPRISNYAVVEVYPEPTLQDLRKRFSNYLKLPDLEREAVVAGLLSA